MKVRLIRTIIIVATSVVALYLILLIPVTDHMVYQSGERSAFTWNNDTYWNELEARFRETRQFGCDSLIGSINAGLIELESMTEYLERDSISANSSFLQLLERKLFDLSVLVAACPDSLSRLIAGFGKLRTAIKEQSTHWDLKEQTARDAIYRLIYGSRSAIEEIILQANNIDLPNLFVENDEPSSTPSSSVLGVKICSGDILVSRGGAPTSALIARGNDYPGNFSHVALVHVDKENGNISIIESHIEIGVTLSNIETYLKDKKLRVMVLRLRSDNSTLQSDPMLPHRAAEYALHRAQNEHIAYDFAMDTKDPKRLFCSEVVFDAYRQYGINLWAVISHISNDGVRNWLAAFGVENFTTMEPSDLEYDPLLRVVAEWRDYETLYKDHIDNAVVDIMLESAEQGERIDYDWFALPFVRILKGYSYLLNIFGKAGPIPEGMNATAALKNEWFSKHHNETVEILNKEADQFYQLNGYVPPYWELIKLARQAYNRPGGRTAFDLTKVVTGRR